MAKRILFFNGAGCGGAERMTILYAKILLKAGFDCKMFIHVKPGSKIDLLEFIPDNLKYEIIETRHRYLLLYLLRILLKEKCEVVFSSMPILIQLLVIARWIAFRKFKLVARCFNMPSKLPAKTIAAIKWFQHVDIIISQTDEMRQELISLMNFPSEKLITINNPVDTELVDSKIKEPFQFNSSYVNYSAVGRISRQKDYITMIEAFKVVLNTTPNSRLYILGKIEEKDYDDILKARIEELGLKDHVFFEGFQSNPYKYIYHSDAFLLSSVFEGLPNVMLEALYLNIPVVATRSIPFIQQVIKDGVNGYSVDIQDSRCFANCMLKAIKLKSSEKVNLDVNNTKEAVVELFQSC